MLFHVMHEAKLRGNLIWYSGASGVPMQIHAWSLPAKREWRADWFQGDLAQLSAVLQCPLSYQTDETGVVQPGASHDCLAATIVASFSKLHNSAAWGVGMSHSSTAGYIPISRAAAAEQTEDAAGSAHSPWPQSWQDASSWAARIPTVAGSLTGSFIRTRYCSSCRSCRVATDQSQKLTAMHSS